MSIDLKRQFNFDFIDGIRAVAMVCIVAEHCITAYDFDPQKDIISYFTYFSIIQFTKFGTIIFFLVAGFLMGDKFEKYSPAQYYKRRLTTIAVPWLFWTCIYILGLWITMRWTSKYYYNNRIILEEIEKIFLYSNYWFVINYLFSIGILLIFRSKLYDYRFGGILAFFTFFYALNVHFEWIPSNHTTAVLGFIFFVWMGAQFRKHWWYIEKKLYRISYLPLLGLTLCFAVLGIMESSALYGIKGNPFNTLRISNILFSLSVFLLLLRMRPVGIVKFLQPRRMTYGIYLTHYLLIVFLLPRLILYFNISVYDLKYWQLVVYTCCVLIYIYGLSFFIVYLIGNTKARTLVGIKK